jgi:uncharacterized membrane protein
VFAFSTGATVICIVVSLVVMLLSFLRMQYMRAHAREDQSRATFTFAFFSSRLTQVIITALMVYLIVSARQVPNRH